MAQTRKHSPDKEEIRASVDAALDLLKEDPPRLKQLLRDAASLAHELGSVLEEADRKEHAQRLLNAAKLVKGGAMLPAGMSIAMIRKALGKLLESAP